jgi:hypothetical protein
LIGGAHAGGRVPEAGEDAGNQEGERDCDDQVIPGLEIIVIGEKGGVTAGPEQKGWDERVAQEAGAEEEDGNSGDEGEGIEDFANPKAIGEGVGHDGEDVGWAEAAVAVGVEEVVEVGKEVGAYDEEVVAEPGDGG